MYVTHYKMFRQLHTAIQQVKGHAIMWSWYMSIKMSSILSNKWFPSAELLNF